MNDWLLWVGVGALVAALATYAIERRREPTPPAGLFCYPEPGADPVEAETVRYLGRESGLHVYLVVFPISPPPVFPRLSIALLPERTRLRIMFDSEEAGLL